MISGMVRRILARGLSHVSRAPSPDGFGQTLAQDARYRVRFRRCRRVAVDWRLPTHEERHAHDRHAIVGRFGDSTIAVAKVGTQDWIVRDRTWHGWPDPPEFVFFALDDGAIWAAADFDGWPRNWRRADAASRPFPVQDA